MKIQRTAFCINTTCFPASCSSILFKFLLILLCLPSFVMSQELFQLPWGKDSALVSPTQNLKKPSSPLPVRIADALIQFHQEVISPIDGPRSHFRPSSSRYMQLAMQRYGFLRGFIMGCDRLLRENDETWIYPTIEIEGQFFKYDPACLEKGFR